MRERRFLGTDLLQHACQPRLAVVQAVLQIGQQNLQPFRLRLAGAGTSGTLVQLAAQLVELLHLPVEHPVSRWNSSSPSATRSSLSRSLYSW